MKLEKEELQSLLKSQIKDRKTSVAFEDVWSSYQSKKEKSKHFKVPKIGLAACATLFVIATPVGANLFMKWNTVVIEDMDEDTLAAIEDITETVPWLKFESYPDYLGTYQQVNLEESEKIAGYEILRPINFNMPSELSVGVLSSDNTFIAYWDLFHKEDEWAYVKQELSTNSDKLLNEESLKQVWVIRPDDKVISFQEKDAIAVISDLGEGGILINMLAKTDKDQVMCFEMRGNISQERMIELATSFLQN